MDGCMVGPVYHTPTVTAPPAYKELTPEEQKVTDGWKVAQPKDDALHGKWWEIFVRWGRGHRGGVVGGAHHAPIHQNQESREPNPAC